MTSTVKITAHCAPTKELIVIVRNQSNWTVIERQVLQDGETVEIYAYDRRAVETYEQEKLI